MPPAVMSVTCQVLCVTLLSLTCTYALSIPPKITVQSPKDIYYKPGEYVKIECEASGVPSPSYTWYRAGKLFQPEGNDKRVVKLKGVGTLLINSPEDKDEGFYQCHASNDYGTAATITFNLRMGKLDPFKHGVKIPPIRRKLGETVSITCQSPDSVPDAKIYWTKENERRVFTAIDFDDRLTVDLRDNLHIAYLKAEDAGKWQCVAWNEMMRRSVLGPVHTIEPIGNSPIEASMKKIWPLNRFDEVGLVGSTMRLKCIFSGNPVPFVKWMRQGNRPMGPRFEQGRSRGQELVIHNLQLEDAGTYMCDGTKEKEPSPWEMSFTLNVHSRPEWVTKPQDVNIKENGTAEFECFAKGSPTPKIFWFVNGKTLEEAFRKDTRLDKRFKHVQANKIVFERVTKHDTMVFQCNVTNDNGAVWGEAALNILNEAPVIIRRPDFLQKVAEGHSFRIPCTVVGSSDVTWYRNGDQVTGGRFIVMHNGDLYVEAAVLADSGTYRCDVRNSWGNDSAQGNLVVRTKTVIEQNPLDLEIQGHNSAKFTCSGTTDPQEAANLKTIWLKDQEPVEYGSKLFLNHQDNSLTISGTEQRDTGTYTCVVTNGLDNDTSSARLVVTAVPDVVTDVRVDKPCVAGGTTELLWMPGTFNNAPIEYFTVEFMTSKDLNNWEFLQKVPYTQDGANISLNAGVDYKFRVTAVNKIGEGPPSRMSSKSCVTTNGYATQNPENVRTVGNVKNKISVEWTPVSPIYHGEQPGGFTYEITLHRHGTPLSSADITTIYDWRTNSYNRTHEGLPYEPYDVTVKSRNSLGEAKAPLHTIIGHAYEGMPVVSPANLEVNNIQSDSADFRWTFPHTEIDSVTTRIRGEFKGFKIQVWQENKKHETFRSWDVGPSQFPNRHKSDEFVVRVQQLLPHSRLLARVAVLNNFFVSKPSDIFKFDTPPGLPGPVEYMEDVNIGDNHINLQWWAPVDNRNDILGYDIGYQEVRGLHVGEMQDRDPQINDPYATTAMLTGLKHSTTYRIHLWARTAAGRGEDFYIQRTTRPPLVLYIPRYTIANVGRDFINVTWWTDAYRDSGTVIYVEYMKKNGREWISTTPNVAQDWVTIRMLDPGVDYVVRVVATNGIITRLSEEADVSLSGNAAAYDLIENVGWFLGMIFAILLNCGLIIGFIVCYRKGFRFKSRDKKIRTFRNGDETYTGTNYNDAQIPRYSKEFWPESKGGHANDYYDDRDSNGEKDRNEGLDEPGIKYDNSGYPQDDYHRGYTDFDLRGDGYEDDYRYDEDNYNNRNTDQNYPSYGASSKPSSSQRSYRDTDSRDLDRGYDGGQGPRKVSERSADEYEDYNYKYGYEDMSLSDHDLSDRERRGHQHEGELRHDARTSREFNESYDNDIPGGARAHREDTMQAGRRQDHSRQQQQQYRQPQDAPGQQQRHHHERDDELNNERKKYKDVVSEFQKRQSGRDADPKPSHAKSPPSPTDSSTMV